MSSSDPLDLAWGTATVEAVNDERGIAVHVFNHSLETPFAIRQNLRFAAGRALWFQRQLPKGLRQVMLFDDRGQAVDPSVKSGLIESLGRHGVKVVFASEGGLRGLQSSS